jgi:hypothetical protein
LRKRLLVIAPVLIAVLLLVSCWGSDTPPGLQVAPDEPKQGRLLKPFSIQSENYRYEGLASFEMTGRILSRSRYRFDHLSRYAPVDLAMGWGPMSDSAVLKHIWIGQLFRFYFYLAMPSTPIPAVGVGYYSANMHMVPADPQVRNTLLAARDKDVLYIKGILIKITDDDGFLARSSLTRDDSGPGGCEIIYVQEAYTLTEAEILAGAKG